MFLKRTLSFSPLLNAAGEDVSLKLASLEGLRCEACRGIYMPESITLTASTPEERFTLEMLSQVLRAVLESQHLKTLQRLGHMPETDFRFAPITDEKPAPWERLRYPWDIHEQK